jgi:hypothetical protein
MLRYCRHDRVQDIMSGLVRTDYDEFLSRLAGVAHRLRRVPSKALARCRAWHRFARRTIRAEGAFAMLARQG